MGEETRQENTISQRSITGGPEFTFRDDHLEYHGTTWEFKTPYNQIAGAMGYSRRKTTDIAPKVALVYISLLALILMRTDHHLHTGSAGFHWFAYSALILIGVVIAVCGPIYFLTHKEYTVVPTAQGNILVVHDKRHDVILQRLQSARLIALRKLADPDPANSPEEELAKLRRLLQEGAISNDDYLSFSSRYAGMVS